MLTVMAIESEGGRKIQAAAPHVGQKVRSDLYDIQSSAQATIKPVSNPEFVFWKNRYPTIILQGEHGAEFDLALAQLIQGQLDLSSKYPIIFNCASHFSNSKLGHLAVALKNERFRDCPLLFINAESLTVPERVRLGCWIDHLPAELANKEQIIAFSVNQKPTSNYSWHVEEDVLQHYKQDNGNLTPLRERVEDLPQMVDEISHVLTGEDWGSCEGVIDHILSNSHQFSLTGNYDELLNAVYFSALTEEMKFRFDLDRFIEYLAIGEYAEQASNGVKRRQQDNALEHVLKQHSTEKASQSGTHIPFGNYVKI